MAEQSSPGVLCHACQFGKGEHVAGRTYRVGGVLFHHRCGARLAIASFFDRLEASNGPDASDACGSLAMYARSHPEAYEAELAARGLPYVSPGPGPGLPPNHPHA